MLVYRWHCNAILQSSSGDRYKGNTYELSKINTKEYLWVYQWWICTIVASSSVMDVKQKLIRSSGDEQREYCRVHLVINIKWKIMSLSGGK